MNYKHGEATKRSPKTKEYLTWSRIKTRCLNPNYKEFNLYGGRGIKMCDRWRSSFSNFLSDMGRAPSPDHSIDRIDNNGNYEPGNCRWATTKEQNKNKSDTLFVTINGQNKPLTEWAELSGIKIDSLRWRIFNKKIPPEIAIILPKHKEYIPNHDYGA